MAKDKSARYKRYRLWLKNKRCRKCGVITTFPKSGKSRGNEPKNLATIDHVFSRNDIRRFVGNNRNKITLYCFKCNQNKNMHERKDLSWSRYESRYPPFDIRELLLTEKLQYG